MGVRNSFSTTDLFMVLSKSVYEAFFIYFKVYLSITVRFNSQASHANIKGSATLCRTAMLGMSFYLEPVKHVCLSTFLK